MKYVIISFQARNSLMAFSKILHLNNIPTKIINTPHKISSSCSLSIKTDYTFSSKIISLLNQSKLSGLLGIYLVTEANQFSQVNKIF